MVKQHRKLATTLNTLIAGGFDLLRLDEFAPTRAQVAAMPELAVERERPMILLVAARKR